MREQKTSRPAFEHPCRQISRSFTQPNKGENPAHFGGHQRARNVGIIAQAMFKIKEQKISPCCTDNLNERGVDDVDDRPLQNVAACEALL
jgi:hypothetical protein